MNDQYIIDILKHNSKINRILNKISQKNPTFAEEIDLALYSSMKISKIIQKLTQNNSNKAKTITKQNGQSSIHLNDEDQLYQNALHVIQGFKTATKKLQKKVGILLRQQQLAKKAQQAKYHNGLNTQYEVPTQQKRTKQHGYPGYPKYQGSQGLNKKHHVSSQNISAFSPHVIQSSQSQNKKQYISSGSKSKSQNRRQKVKIRQYINEEQSFQEAPDDESKNISQLDQQIIELASQIKHIMKYQ